MRQAQLSNTVTATYNESSERYSILERHDSTRILVMLNRDEMSKLIDFVMEMTQKRLDDLKGLVDYSEQAHLVHLVDLQRRLQGEA